MFRLFGRIGEFFGGLFGGGGGRDDLPPDEHDYVHGVEDYESGQGAEDHEGEPESFDAELDDGSPESYFQQFTSPEQDIEDSIVEESEFEPEHAPEPYLSPYDIQAEQDQFLADLAQDRQDAENQAEQASGLWPDWMMPEQIAEAKDWNYESYDDIPDLDRAFMFGDDPDGAAQGTDDTDYPAEEWTPEELDEAEQAIRDAYNIDPDIILSEEDIFTLATLDTDNDDIKWGREFFGDEDYNQDDLARELDIEYRGQFDDWGEFLNSGLYEFIQDHPDWFTLDIYYDEDGNVVIDVYEVY